MTESALSEAQFALRPQTEEEARVSAEELDRMADAIESAQVALKFATQTLAIQALGLPGVSDLSDLSNDDVMDLMGVIERALKEAKSIALEEIELLFERRGGAAADLHRSSGNPPSPLYPRRRARP